MSYHPATFAEFQRGLMRAMGAQPDAPATGPRVTLPAAPAQAALADVLDAAVREMLLAGDLHSDDAPVEASAAPPATRWKKMPPRPDEAKLALVREVEAMLDADPRCTIRAACAAVGQPRGIRPDTLHKYRSSAIAHGLITRRPVRAGDAMTITPQMRTIHRAAVAGR